MAHASYTARFSCWPPNKTGALHTGRCVARYVVDIAGCVNANQAHSPRAVWPMREMAQICVMWRTAYWLQAAGVALSVEHCQARALPCRVRGSALWPLLLSQGTDCPTAPPQKVPVQLPRGPCQRCAHTDTQVSHASVNAVGSAEQTYLRTCTTTCRSRNCFT